jgi:hypothetical protein
MSPGIPAAHRTFRPLRPWSAFSLPRYISKHSTTQTQHALAGRADLRDGRHQRQSRRGGGWQGGASRRPPQGATTRRPGGTPGKHDRRWARMVPPGRRVVGRCQVDGMPHGFQRARSVPVSPRPRRSNSESAGREESRPNPPATGRAKSVPDTAVTPGVQWGATGTADCHSPANAPTCHRRSGTVSAGVAGQGFEPWKACADGFTNRLHPGSVWSVSH